MFKAWNTGDLQDFMSLLNVAESKGIKDIHALKKELETNLHSRRLEFRKRQVAYKQGSKKKYRKNIKTTCGKCGFHAVKKQVNVSKCTKIENEPNLKIAIECVNNKCLHVEYL